MQIEIRSFAELIDTLEIPEINYKDACEIVRLSYFMIYIDKDETKRGLISALIENKERILSDCRPIFLMNKKELDDFCKPIGQTRP